MTTKARPIETTEHLTWLDITETHKPVLDYTMCDCGWMPKAVDERKVHIALNVHITRERRKMIREARSA